MSIGPPSSNFRWLDALEKEFDKSFVDLDLLLGEIDSDQAEITTEGRQKMTALSSAFAQLIHKVQTIFQNNVKLEVCKPIKFTRKIIILYKIIEIIYFIFRHSRHPANHYIFNPAIIKIKTSSLSFRHAINS